jgi:penicillin-insensitive murein DD-endopeptidase
MGSFYAGPRSRSRIAQHNRRTVASRRILGQPPRVLRALFPLSCIASVLAIAAACETRAPAPPTAVASTTTIAPAQVSTLASTSAPTPPNTPPAAPPTPAPPKPAPPKPAPPPPVVQSTSTGSPQTGHLQNAALLPERGPGFRHHPDKAPDRRYGTTELVTAVVRAAAQVEQTLPGSELSIGDIGLERGGPLQGHASHQNGRDVDIMFFLLDAQGEPRPGHGVPFDLKGEGHDYKKLDVAEDDVPVRIDIPRTWKFAEALVSDPNAHIQRIFVAEHVRNLLLDHARSISAPDTAIARFAFITCQPSSPHDDHFHIRFFCSADDIAKGCTDRPPLYPWQQAYLEGLGVKAKYAKPLPKTGPNPNVKTEAQARAEAGPLHPDVVEFLDRRKAWSKPPKTGRQYCW